MSFIDSSIQAFDGVLRGVTGSLAATTRKNPAVGITAEDLTHDEKKHAAGLMRVNHSGEVCAQALYLGQSLVAKSSAIKKALKHSAEEEVDHLFWCQERVHALGAEVSYLNPLWFAGSFMLGMLAGLAGDRWNLGFLAETEHQVEKHLQSHREKLPTKDLQSLAIVHQMQIDEAKHAKIAVQHGAAELPSFVKKLMQGMSKLMTHSAYWW